MKNLIEISKLVTLKRVRKIEIFDDNALRNQSSKFNQFYAALLENKFKNDRDAAAQIYDTTPLDPKYRQLKSRFKKRLLNTLFFLDVNKPDSSNYDRAYYTCNREWTLVKILLSHNAVDSACSLARQLLTTAFEYKFADIIVNCSRILREQASMEGDEKVFEEYDMFIKQYYHILEAEVRSEELFQRVLIYFRNPRKKEEEIKSKIDSYCDALVSLSEIYESPVINYNMFMVWICRYEMFADYEAMLEVCERAEKFVEANPNYYQQDKVASIQIKKMTAFLHMRDYRMGRVSAEKYLSELSVHDEGSDSWFNYLELYYLLSMHTQNYINAWAITSKVTEHKEFKKLNTFNREKWRLYESYTIFFLRKEGLNNTAKWRRKSTGVSYFLEPNNLEGSEGLTLPILSLMLEVLQLLDADSVQKAENKIDDLKGYTAWKLKKDEYFRTFQIIKLLVQLMKSGFDRTQLSNTEKYWSRLEETPFSYRGNVEEIEIVPYEQLWSVFQEFAK